MVWCEWPRRGLVAFVLAVTVTAPPAAAGDRSDPPDTSRAACEADELLAKIRAEAETLDRRERLLREHESTSAAARQELSLRMQELEGLRLDVEKEVARLDAVSDERVGRIADVYGRMPADRAAAVIGALEPELAARIVARMRRSRAAAVLAELPRAQAVDLSRRIVRPGRGEAGIPSLAEREKRVPGAASVP